MGAYIIAEAGVNHNGSVEIALRMCDAAKEAGADAIKFQTWKTERLLTRNVEQAEYQVRNTRCKESQFDMLKRLELSEREFITIKEYCNNIGMCFASTADEEESLDFLISIGIPFIKVGSGDIGNIPYLRKIGGKGLPVIMSTGMSTIGDVDMSIRALREGGACETVLLHCTTSYPCPYNDVNLRAMDTLKNAFALPVGYSDHTVGIDIPVAAVARGAVIIEKHFTLNRKMQGPDHLASTEPDEFRKMVAAIRNVERAFGNGIKEPTLEEKKAEKIVAKRIIANHYIPAGSVIKEEDICAKRNDQGIPVMYWDFVVGRKAKRNFEREEAVEL